MSLDRTRLLFPIALTAFVSLGLPDGVLGVAWPSIRRTFDLPLSQLGVLLTATTAGYFAASFGSGPIVVRLGVGRLLLASSAVMVLSLATFALAPGWPPIVAAGVLAGLGGGAIDAGINAFAATACSPRRTAWLHACYGVGATLGPLVMTGVLAAGWSWRSGYAATAAVLAVMAVAFALTRDAWPLAARGDAPSADMPGIVETLRRPIVVAHVALFFVYTGLEVAAGQWTYSLFTEARGVPPAVAGTWAALYWGSLTAGRVALAGLLRRASLDHVLRVTMTIAPGAALTIWLGDSRLAMALGVAGLGLSLAPVFPLLVSATPRRVGAGYATHAIGAQVAAAYLGAATVPGAAGVLARAYGLEIIGPLLTVTALGVFVAHEIVLRTAASAPPSRVR